jgi:HTH-type transcriptional regulator/antitoxin HipB
MTTPKPTTARAPGPRHAGRLVQSPAAFGRALRDARQLEKLTQQQLAELSGVAQSTISNVERGVMRRVSLDTLLRLLAALRLELVVQPRWVEDEAPPNENAT